MEEDLRVKRTRLLLRNALLDLLQEKPFDKINVNDICERAIVHRATFYNHFNDKNDLFNYVLDEIEEELFESAIEGGEFSSSEEMFKYIIDNLFSFVQQNREKFKLILSHDGEKLIARIAAAMKRSVRYFISKNKYNDNYVVPLDVIVDFFLGGITFIMLDFISNGSYKKEEIMEFFSVLIDEKLFLKH